MDIFNNTEQKYDYLFIKMYDYNINFNRMMNKFVLNFKRNIIPVNKLYSQMIIFESDHVL